MKTMLSAFHDRDPVESDFVGKTIARVNLNACNIWRLYFTDGTAIAIEAEVHNSSYGGIPVMQVCEPCVQTPNNQKKICGELEDCA